MGLKPRGIKSPVDSQHVIEKQYGSPKLRADEMLNSENYFGSDVMRTKRIGSLSIVNNLDVLRQRVLLELARRKALQDQRQVEENRRFLESVGKRSVSNADRIVRSSMNNERSATSDRNEWTEENNPLFRELQDDRTVINQCNNPVSRKLAEMGIEIVHRSEMRLIQCMTDLTGAHNVPKKRTKI
ncbi:Diuretic hormone class 1 [Acromyrmex echinatior]|uniref:Diuretic hormone class 1 n=1 Tax=Acromyrmex echinatior TaxID=103372 RepID=F4X307_ACREC|nr:Diuretic hormone class 1 [Acromyrmex echinatior]